MTKNRKMVAQRDEQDSTRAGLRSTRVSTAARWMAPALLAALVLAGAAAGRPDSAPGQCVPDGPAAVSQQQESEVRPPTTAECLEPPSKTTTTSSEHGLAGDHAELDPELRAYLDYLRGNECNLNERERLLDTKAVNGASRAGLHAAGYSYGEIEDSFKRVLEFLDRRSTSGAPTSPARTTSACRPAPDGRQPGAG